MAEEFLEDIYQKAMLIEQLKEYIEYTDSGRVRDARAVYNLTAEGIEHILLELEQTEPSLAERIIEAAVQIRDNFDDHSAATAVAEGQLIPALYSYIKNYTGIEVEEGKFRFLSSESGFLTIMDNNTGYFIHSSFDPMWEAYRIAASIFDPQIECYHILGVGLGYLPYQLWRQSEGAVKLVLYEEDESVISYARAYGVLEWIAPEALDLVCFSDEGKLTEIFLEKAEMINDKKETREVAFITPWKKKAYKNKAGERISAAEADQELMRSMSFRTAINIWKNSLHKQISFEKLKQMFYSEEWIVVSAGPSFDEQLDFLINSGGKRKIIAVNTVLRRLFKEGIQPDIVAAADQYVQMREHIEGIGDKTERIPLIAEKRLNWQYAEQYKGSICFVTAGGDTEEGAWDISGSVAGLALEAAVRLGAKKVFLVGQDLAYPDGKTYAEGMPYSADGNKRGTIQVKAVDGTMVPTSEAFNWFRIGLENQIAKYNSVDFYNLSQHGALIRGCKNNNDKK